MNAFVSRGIITLAVTGGLLVLGAGAAHADDGTDGNGGLISGLQGVLDADLPITISGNGISVAGDSSSSGSSGSGSTGGSAPSGSTSGSDSLLGGTQGLIGLNVPINASGNAVSVLADSSSEGSSFEGSEGSGGTSTGTTSGKDGILGGTQAVGGVNAPVTVSGNAISVLGDSSSSGSTPAAGTSGSGSSSGSTSGEGSAAGGTQVLLGGDIPVTVGGNAISVTGDSTVDDGGQPGEVGGETITPPTTGDPGTTGGLSTAALSVSALAETGSALLPWALAFALLLMAAGATFLARARTARS